MLASPGGIVDLLPEEGEKAPRGRRWPCSTRMTRPGAKEEPQSLTMEKGAAQYALERTQSGGDSSQPSQ